MEGGLTNNHRVFMIAQATNTRETTIGMSCVSAMLQESRVFKRTCGVGYRTPKWYHLNFLKKLSRQAREKPSKSPSLPSSVGPELKHQY